MQKPLASLTVDPAPLYSFPGAAAVTNHHKLHGLTQLKCIFSQFCGPVRDPASAGPPVLTPWEAVLPWLSQLLSSQQSLWTHRFNPPPPFSHGRVSVPVCSVSRRRWLSAVFVGHVVSISAFVFTWTYLCACVFGLSQRHLSLDLGAYLSSPGWSHLSALNLITLQRPFSRDSGN